MRTTMWPGLVALTSSVAAAKDQPLTFPMQDVAVQSTLTTGEVSQTYYLASERSLA